MSLDTLPQVVVAVDGSCLGNPGPGGWAVVLQCGPHEKELVGGAEQTTNNRMELQAVIAGLQTLKRRCQVRLLTDSQYVAFILSDGKAKANLDLVDQARRLAAAHLVTVEKVAGHSGHPLNERCDRLAQTHARGQLADQRLQ
jgi:ribonuclease HI